MQLEYSFAFSRFCSAPRDGRAGGTKHLPLRALYVQAFRAMEPNLEEGAVSIGVSVWRPNLDITKGHSFLVGNPTGGPTGVLGTVAVDPRMPLDLFRDVISTERSGRIRKRRSWFQEALSSIQEVDNFFGRYAHSTCDHVALSRLIRCHAIQLQSFTLVLI